MTDIHLTEEQQKIVAHEHGPALVLAVAGAGKTLAMERRIARLVNDGLFAQERILATTFNKSAATELQERIRRHPGCTTFEATTLHAFGLKITGHAAHVGYLPWLQPDALNDVDQAARKILYGAIRRAKQTKAPFLAKLQGFDHDDFLTYVSLCKGQLAYPNLDLLESLPVEAQKTATLAREPKQNSWYLELYRFFEAERVERGLFTYDDMIMTGWELLARHAEIREAFQGRYDCVVVDEFQDINRAQAEMLDLLVQEHGNYMVVGDDDQTIYTWRGADPSYIWTFEKRYAAMRYYLTDNFRCSAPQIAIANAIIKHNRRRAPKKLHLTQGFEGEARVSKPGSQPDMARRIVAAIQNAKAAGHALNDVAILVRIYAQTGPIEQALIDEDIPYEVLGGSRFFDRFEVRVLIAYCRLAFFERRLQNQQPLSGKHQEFLRASWNEIYRQNNRYLTRDQSNRIVDLVLTTHEPIASVLRSFASEVKQSTGKGLKEFADTLEWLASPQRTGVDARESAYVALKALIDRLDYLDFLRERSEFSGIEEAENVEAFLRYALNKGNLHEFLAGVHALSEQVAEEVDNEDRVRILSMHRAKGLEWPIVIIPDCNEEIIPHKRAQDDATIEEERRLLYVAVTRAKKELLLYIVNTKTKKPSSFLTQANVERILRDVKNIATAIKKSSQHWKVEEQQSLQRGIQEYGFERYLLMGCGLPKEVTDKLKTLMQTGPISNPASQSGQGQSNMAKMSQAKSQTVTQATVAHWKKGQEVFHPTHGKGRVQKVVQLDGKTWVEVRFGKDDYIQVEPKQLTAAK